MRLTRFFFCIFRRAPRHSCESYLLTNLQFEAASGLSCCARMYLKAVNGTLQPFWSSKEIISLLNMIVVRPEESLGRWTNNGFLSHQIILQHISWKFRDIITGEWRNLVGMSCKVQNVVGVNLKWFGFEQNEIKLSDKMTEPTVIKFCLQIAYKTISLRKHNTEMLEFRIVNFGLNDC